VQIVHSSWRGSRDTEHIGPVHEENELEVQKEVARQWLAAGQVSSRCTSLYPFLQGVGRVVALSTSRIMVKKGSNLIHFSP
jgi:hypothetical protein